MRWLTSILALAATPLALTGCDVGEAQVTDHRAQPAPVPVETTNATTGQIHAWYGATTNIEADSEAAVTAKVSGEILEIYVEEGDRVVAGQLLARLDSAGLQLILDRALAEYRKVEQEYDRNRELHRRGLVSADAFEDLEFDRKALKAAFELTRLELGYTEIRAPIDGVLSERLAKIGNTVAAGESLFRISNMNSLLAYLHVPQNQLSVLAAGQQAEVKADALPGASFPAIISRIAPTVDPDTGTFKVTLRFDETADLAPGMFVRVRVAHDVRHDAILIPNKALVRNDDEIAVYVVEDGAARRRLVETGYVEGSQIEIRSGVGAEEQVIVVGHSGLRDGSPVVASDSVS